MGHSQPTEITSEIMKMIALHATERCVIGIDDRLTLGTLYLCYI